MLALKRAGAVAFDYGNNIAVPPSLLAAPTLSSFPVLFPEYISPALLHRSWPVPLGSRFR